MAKISQKIPAKLNLTLDVKGKIGDFHEIESLVVSVNLFDKIILKKRKDNEITVKEKGFKTELKAEDNNAFKAVKLFMETYGTSGVDITVKKKIPLSAGLGGSAADIVAVLIGMKKLFHIDADLKKLAEKLGSDAVYMLNGGFAMMTERGIKSVNLKLGFPLYFILLTNEKGISSKECYDRFDFIGKSSESTTETAFSYILLRDFIGFKNTAKNDLYIPAKDLLPEIEGDMEELKKEEADFVSMTGSGSSLFMMFKDRKKRNEVFKNLVKKGYGGRLIKAKSIE